MVERSPEEAGVGDSNPSSSTNKKKMRTEDYDWLFEDAPIETPSEPTKAHTELKVGDKVRIKSLEWYEKNKDSTGHVNVPEIFVPQMVEYCRGTYKIKEIVKLRGKQIYKLEGTNHWNFSEEMFDLD